MDVHEHRGELLSRCTPEQHPTPATLRRRPQNGLRLLTSMSALATSARDADNTFQKDTSLGLILLHYGGLAAAA